MYALVYDWLSFSMILIGIISNGWATTVIGKGRPFINSVKKPAEYRRGIPVVAPLGRRQCEQGTVYTGGERALATAAWGRDCSV